jgi:hypothetical protein
VLFFKNLQEFYAHLQGQHTGSCSCLGWWGFA